MRDVLKNPQPSPKEAVLVISLAFAVTFFFAYFDRIIHDTFVLPDIIEAGGDLTVGVPYWSLLTGVFLFIATAFLFFRIGVGKLAGAKTNGMLIFIAFLWFFSLIILFYTGWLDYFYYVVGNEPVPETLHWLNNFGFFVIFQHLGNDPNMVEHGDLSALMFFGLVLLIGLWALMVHHHKKGNLKKLGLV